MGAQTGTTEGEVREIRASDELTFEEIAERAYELHLSGTGGDDIEDWLAAEAQLRAERSAPSPEPKPRRKPAAKPRRQLAA